MGKEELNNNPEFQALTEIEGLDFSSFGDDKGTPPAGTPPAGTPPAGTPPAGTPPAGGAGKEKVDGAASQDVFLKEIFGDRFKTIDDAKKANIAQQLQDLESLRQEKQALEAKLSAKPKTSFVNDDIALYNEFVRETGVSNYDVFKRIHSADIANMDPMDALIAARILKQPELHGKEAQVRKFFEKKYSVDPDVNEADEIEVNKIGLISDAEEAKKTLKEVKEKLKVAPEQEQEERKPLTPEQKTQMAAQWTPAAEKVTEVLSNIQVPIKGGKAPLLSYALTKEEVEETKKFIVDYAVENQMELTADNAKQLAMNIRNHLLISKFPDIVHSIFEKARKMTEKEILTMYENPNPQRNNDNPPGGSGGGDGDPDKISDAIFDAEMGQLEK